MKVPIYTAFAKIYDQTMEQVPYQEWADFINMIIKEYDSSRPKEKKILEIACGSGTFLKIFNDYYPQTIGLDFSIDMLNIARPKIPNALVQGDMRFLPFCKDTFDVLINLHDSLNYLQTLENLQMHFTQAASVLKNKGLYIFDLSSEYNVLRYYDGKTFYENHNGFSMRWQNEYDSLTRVITSVIELHKDKERYQETHYQKIFTEKELMQVAKNSGFQFLQRYADYTTSIEISKAQLLSYVFQKI